MSPVSFPSTALKPKRSVQRDIERTIERLRSSSSTGLHLGCGSDLIEGLTNCDRFNPAADKAVDAIDLSEYPDGSVDYIETHHMLEHLSFDEANRAIREWARVLRPHGVLVITCPDFSALVRRAAYRSRSHWSDTMKMIYGSQEHPGMFHRSGYDRKELTRMLQEAGLSASFSYTPYPRRPTPSLIIIAEKPSAQAVVLKES